MGDLAVFGAWSVKCHTLACASGDRLGCHRLRADLCELCHTISLQLSGAEKIKIYHSVHKHRKILLWSVLRKFPEKVWLAPGDPPALSGGATKTTLVAELGTRGGNPMSPQRIKHVLVANQVIFEQAYRDIACALRIAQNGTLGGR